MLQFLVDTSCFWDYLIILDKVKNNLQSFIQSEHKMHLRNLFFLTPRRPEAELKKNKMVFRATLHRNCICVNATYFCIFLKLCYHGTRIFNKFHFSVQNFHFSINQGQNKILEVKKVEIFP